MHILLTNDDGIHAPGIRALWEEMSKIAKVSVVAPDNERSACSQSITVHNPIWVSEYSISDYPIAAFKVGGTPTDCVKLALKVLLDDYPDVIVSGINNGSNLGTDVLYSGTVSAAIEGALNGVPSLAVSLDSHAAADYAYAAQIAREITETMLKKGLPPNTLLNVNVPALAPEQIKGRVVTKLGIRHYENTFDKRQDPWGRSYYWMGGKIAEGHNDPDSDIAAVTEGKISVTPIHFDLTNYRIMNIIENWKL